MNLVSTDNRRELYELGSGGDWKVCKYIVVKEDAIIGGHFHNFKSELFSFIKGSGMLVINGAIEHVQAPYSVLIEPGVRHTFHMEAGSEIICLASEVHDPSDDHKL